MTYLEIIAGNPKIINVYDDQALVITDDQSVTDLIMACREQETDRIIIDKKYVTPEFFAFDAGAAAQLVEHFASYQMRLVIYGEMAHLNKLEELSRQTGAVFFAPSRAEAIKILRPHQNEGENSEN